MQMTEIKKERERERERDTHRDRLDLQIVTLGDAQKSSFNFTVETRPE